VKHCQRRRQAKSDEVFSRNLGNHNEFKAKGHRRGLLVSRVPAALDLATGLMRRSLKKLVTLIYVVTATLLLLEGGVRMWGYAERHILDPIYAPFERTKDIPYVHKPNLVNARARGFAIINTDALGLRSKTAGATYGPKERKEYRIAIVGDSVTFGEGVTRTADTYCQVLEDTLNQKQKLLTVRVFNYGATAYSVKQMAAMLPFRMLDIEPDLVLMAIIPSDFNLTRTPGIVSSGFIVDERWASILLPGSLASHVLRRIRLVYVLKEIDVSMFKPQVGAIKRHAREEVPETYSYVKKFRDMAEQHRLPYAIVLLPQLNTDTWEGIPSQLARDGITHVDLSFLGKEFTKEQYWASRFDPHPSPAVHRRIGQELAQDILERVLKM